MIYNKKDLKNTLKTAFEKASILKTEVLFSYTFKIDSNFETIKSNILNDEQMFYLSLPKKENQFIGMGNLNSKNNNAKDLSKLTVVSNLENNKDTFLIFNISAFDQDRKTEKPWEGIHRKKFIIPKLLLQKNKQITLNEIINLKNSENDLLSKVEQNIKELSSKSIVKHHQTTLKKTKTIPEKNDYINTVNDIVSDMKNSKLKKIVLSKVEKLSLKSEILIHKIIENMEHKYHDCFNFFIRLNNEDSFFGSSPEILLKKDELQLSSVALAGTSIKKEDLNDLKEIEEHHYVLKHIKSIFLKYCNDVQISKTNKLKMNYAYHLHSTIKGQLKKNINVFEVIKNLYPTPALSGYPKNDAIDKIKEIEIFDRGYYGGLIGFYNQNMNGSFFVPIRSALKRKNDIYLFAGGGITEKSESLKEWEETEIKLKHIKSIIELK